MPGLRGKLNAHGEKAVRGGNHPLFGWNNGSKENPSFPRSSAALLTSAMGFSPPEQKPVCGKT